MARFSHAGCLRSAPRHLLGRLQGSGRRTEDGKEAGHHQRDLHPGNGGHYPAAVQGSAGGLASRSERLHAKKGQEDPGSRIEEYAPLMRQAEEAGLMPERIIIDPARRELKTNPNAYLDMEDAMDAFTNVYPESSFVCEPFMITSGLANPDPLKAAFVTMALSIGISISMMKADVFDPKIREAFFAAQALLDEGDGRRAIGKV